VLCVLLVKAFQAGVFVLAGTDFAVKLLTFTRIVLLLYLKPLLSPIWEVWLQSYYEEKRGIQSLATYQKITLGKYRALWEKGAPEAIPTMYVLTIKKDKILLLLGAKRHIVVLGNHKDRVWSKSD
jgi:hypothetical protein